jgi:acetyl-CoA acetyltransferase
MPKATEVFTRTNAVYDTTIGWRFTTKTREDVLPGHGETAENVAKRYNLSRERQDEFAMHSQQKANSNTWR